jgi:hypothetical protein
VNSSQINVPRLIRIATLLFAVLLGSIVYFHFQVRVDAMQYRIDDAEAALRSGEVAASEMGHLRDERDALASRYARRLNSNAQAIFLRELIALVQARDVTLVATSLSRAKPTRGNADGPELLTPTHVTLELRGTYRNLLLLIAALSTGSEIVAVEPPDMRRDGTAVMASVPVTIYEPARRTEAER